ncbi:hypothetical protein WME94_45255 [Sorangium sp. So ce429]
MSDALQVNALVLAGFAGFVATTGCTVKLGTGSDDSVMQPETGDVDTVQPGVPTTPEEQAEEAYRNIDPVALAFASAKAGFVTSYIVGATEDLGLDPTMLDESTLQSLLQQFVPLAAEEADRWLATLDPEALKLSLIVKWECGQQGCNTATPCKYLAPPVDHICYVDDCGSAKCRNCPDWIAEALKGIVWKTWCSYVCVEMNTSPPKIVMSAAGAVSSFGDNFVGPICIP